MVASPGVVGGVAFVLVWGCALEGVCVESSCAGARSGMGVSGAWGVAFVGFLCFFLGGVHFVLKEMARCCSGYWLGCGTGIKFLLDFSYHMLSNITSVR